MSTLKTYFNITCYSFTLLVLLYATLAGLNVFPPLSTSNIFLFLFITMCISILMIVTDRLPIKNNLFILLIRLLDIVFVVFTIGILSDLFPLEWSYILYTLGMILVIYFSVYAVLMIKDQSDAKAINKQIRNNFNKSKSKGEENA